MSRKPFSLLPLTLSVLLLTAPMHAEAVYSLSVATPSGIVAAATSADLRTDKEKAKEEAKKARRHARYEAKKARKQASKEKQQARDVARSEKEAKKMQEKMAKLEPVRCYLYGAGINFLDSVVYVTEHQYLDSIYIEPDGQLRNHYAYTAAINFYLESKYQLNDETCAVFYGDDEKKSLKRYQKMMALLRKRHFIVNVIPTADFAFEREDGN